MVLKAILFWVEMKQEKISYNNRVLFYNLFYSNTDAAAAVFAVAV